MSAQRLEAFLAQLFVDQAARQRFLASPRAAAEQAGLSARDCAALEQIDLVGLEFAADSFAKKRAVQTKRQPTSIFSRLGQRLGGS